MNSHRWASVRALAVAALVVAVCAAPVFGFTPREPVARFDERVIADPGAVLAVRTVEVGQLPELDPLRLEWDSFEAQSGGTWKIHVDPRTGLPTLALGRLAWVPGPGNDLPQGDEPITIERLETLARSLIDRHPTILGNWRGQLVLDRQASFVRGERLAQVVLRQEIGGVRVEGARFDFQVSQGNLVAFGASRLLPASIDAVPVLRAEDARAALVSYLDAGSAPIEDKHAPELVIVPMDPRGAGDRAWDGVRGTGIAHRLAWRVTLHVHGEEQTWVGKIDAKTGEVIAFYDDTHYEAVRGGVYPISPDGNCANDGCELPGFPMPFVDVSEAGGADVFTGDFGLYECSTIGSDIRTNLFGKYFNINDACGAVNEATTCDEALDMGISAGANCAVQPGSSAGNTEASRSLYYSINRVAQKGRFYLPNNTWLQGRVQANSNVNSTCNASWSGQVNMYRAGNGCGNTSTINGVVTHEWGHGFDQNDGGGYDSTSEAYADTVAMFETRESCVGRGFYADGRTCSAYGDTCATCTGIRDHDWTKRASNTPSTPTNFTDPRCGSGSGPCGRQVHCESYVIVESMFDLATRDLPAMGMDEATAWQLAERLWYSSRQGSGGPIYNCSLPSSDSCGTTGWYHQMRLADDDDGNLANGTPHAAAIFAAFDRHDIACGTASSPENQNSGACPTLAKPVVTARALTNAVELGWDPVPGAGSYVIHRADIGCDRGHTPLASVAAPAVSYNDDEVINDFTVYYRVQAFGTNDACSGPVSDCVEAAPQPFAGKVRFDQATYGCSNTITVRVTDANVGAATVAVSVWSDSEPTPETVVLTETAPDSGRYTGTILSTSGAPVNGDGLLSIANGDAMSVEYVDADDGAGGINQARLDDATGDCVFPVITNVEETGVTGTQATVNWDTDELSDTVLVWGETIPPTNTKTGPLNTTDHAVTLTGLQECTVYYYAPQSTDAAGNTAFEDNAGRYFYFETLGNFGDGLQPCRAGQTAFDESVYSCSDTATFRVTDIDLNVDTGAIETVALLVSSTSDPDGETVIVTETGPNTSKFTGSIATVLGAGVAGDGLLQLQNADVITVTYRDDNDGTGAPAIDFDTAIADCLVPGVSDLRVDTVTDQRATVRWTTAEPSSTVLEWGTTPALGQTSTDGALKTGHAVMLNQFTDCQEIYFRVKGTDAYGNSVVWDDNGAPFRFSLGTIPGLYYRATFENGPDGWTLQGEWQVQAPQALAGDPATAYNNDGVLGHDLSGQGTVQGGYEPNTAQSAFSPFLNATTWDNTKLLFQRRLRVHSSDEASIWLSAGPGYPIFRSDGQTIRDTNYTLQQLDVSSLVDGKPQVRFEFRQNADLATEDGGWNVDDFILKDGALPDYGSCTNCSTVPSFAGATSAVDNDACGVTGVTVSWARAVAWGSGSTGTYSVYRGETPSFTPSPANRIATGVTGLSYNDATAPTDRQLWYIVQAESDETCGGGPANGGAVDGNTRRVVVTETSSRPVPGEVAGLDVDLSIYAHVRLHWDAATDATRYRVFRAPSPQAGDFTLLGESDTTSYEDLNQGGSAETWFYLVRGANPCGDEGP